MWGIEREHPTYRAKRALWRRYRDLYTGGQQLIDNAAEYLQPRRKEPADIYQERLQQVFYENYVGSIVDWYASTVFRREPVLMINGSNVPAKTFFTSFIDDCDLQGTHFADLLRMRFIEALVSGASYVLIDFPHIPEPVNSRAEEDSTGASRAYLVPVNAEDLINWGYDERGNLEWAVVRTAIEHSEGPTGVTGSKETRWTYYDRSTYRTYRQTSDSRGASPIELVSTGRHGLARLNRTPLFRLEFPEGLWLLNKAGSLQLEHFNKSNALSWALSMGLYAMPVVYSDRKWNQMVGESYYIQLGPEDRFGWTEPEGKVYEIAAANLSRLQAEIYRICYVSQMGRSSETAAVQSGLSKLRDFSITQEVLRAYGDSVKELARRILQSIEAAREDGLIVDVSGMDEFDIGDFSSELQNARDLMALNIGSPTLTAEIKKKLALKYLCEARQEIKDRIASEIDPAPEM